MGEFVMCWLLVVSCWLLLVVGCWLLGRDSLGRDSLGRDSLVVVGCWWVGIMYVSFWLLAVG